MSADVRYIRDAEGGYDVYDRATGRWLGFVFEDAEAHEWLAEANVQTAGGAAWSARFVGIARTRREATDLILNGGAS